MAPWEKRYLGESKGVKGKHVSSKKCLRIQMKDNPDTS